MSSYKGIAINHKKGMLWLRSPDFAANFTNMKEAKDPIKFLPFIAKALLRKCRFAGQLADDSPEGWSILHHSLACGEFAYRDNRDDDFILHCLMHDIGEAFYVDVPSPFKTEENEAVEKAIVEAMPYPWIMPFFNHTPGYLLVHRIDLLSGVMEAKLFGNNWVWPKERVHEFPRKAVSTMKDILDDIGQKDLAVVKSEWLVWCEALLKRLGRSKRVV